MDIEIPARMGELLTLLRKLDKLMVFPQETYNERLHNKLRGLSLSGDTLKLDRLMTISNKVWDRIEPHLDVTNGGKDD